MPKCNSVLLTGKDLFNPIFDQINPKIPLFDLFSYSKIFIGHLPVIFILVVEWRSGKFMNLTHRNLGSLSDFNEKERGSPDSRSIFWPGAGAGAGALNLLTTAHTQGSHWAIKSVSLCATIVWDLKSHIEVHIYRKGHTYMPLSRFYHERSGLESVYGLARIYYTHSY